MTRYEELLEEIGEEKRRLVQEFTQKARVGDFVKYRDIVGILFAGKNYTKLKFVPVKMPMYMGCPELQLDSDNIPEMSLISEEEFSGYFKTIALKHAEADKDLPF